VSAARALGATWAAACREAVANRRGFWTQLTVMVANDVAWVVFWLIFFDQVGSVRGWDRDTLLTLLAVLTTSGGVVLGFLANSRHLGQLAADGGLDATLSLPVPPLLHLLARRVHPSNVGDAVFGIGLFVVAGDPTPSRTAWFALVVLLSSTVLASFLVVAGSLSFFVGRNDAGELGFHSILMFASYPVDIFTGAMKVLLYTAVPAGFVSAVPARIVEEPSAGLVSGLLVAAAVIGVAAWVTFTAGLRRYTSGSVWTRA
jgi:ABC-2 type transport system permease protein